MPLNSSKLDAIRAKLAATAVTTATSNIAVNQESKNAPSLNQNPISSGKTAVTTAIIALEATAGTISKIVQVENKVAETAGKINFQRVADSVAELATAIHSAHPRMPQLLHDIWSTLHKYPEQVTLLSEEQMEVVFSGLEKIVDTDLAALTLKSATKSGGKKAPVTTASLGF